MDQSTESKSKNLTVAHWTKEIERATKEEASFREKGTKIVKRYRDDRDGARDETRFNILWSNVNTLKSALYGNLPKPDVSRRFKDRDPVARVASLIIERCLEFEVEQNSDYDTAMRSAVLDRLLPGRGTAWVRFHADVMEADGMELDETQADGEAMISEDVEDENYPTVSNESSPCDYVYWKDFLCSPARTWEEVEWVARRVYMSRDKGIERFGPEFADVPLLVAQKGVEDKELVSTQNKRAEVWEIWCKTSKKVYWVSKGYPKFLDRRDDPLELECFFPCPKPLYATITTDCMTPVADYILYQDQDRELNELTSRINNLMKALKVIGVYDSTQTGLKRMLDEGIENQLIPVDSWAAFGEKGGLKGAVDFMPLGEVITVVTQLTAMREQVKQTIYEITGISDVIRGATNANETATAQQIKTNYASLRLKEMQADVGRFAQDLLRIKAEIICTKYQPETLVSMSGVDQTESPEAIMAALQLIADEPMRNFRIEIDVDTLVAMDQEKEKQSRMEFLTAAGSFLKQSAEVGAQAPAMIPLLGEMLMFGVRGFKVGRTIEGAFDEAMEQAKNAQQQGDGGQAQMMQMQQQMEQMQAQHQQQLQQVQASADIQAKSQIEQMKVQADGQVEMGKAQVSQQAEANKAQLEQIKMQHEAQREAARLEFDRWKTELENATKVLIAQMSKQNDMEGDMEEGDDMEDKPDPMMMINAMMEQMRQPKAISVERDETGRIIGAVSS